MPPTTPPATAPAVDLRSDTVTRPTAAMREAMAYAAVGDDVFGDDPTVAALEARVAALLGKDAAVLVPSGTMANQIGLRLHTRHGDEAIVHAGSHVFNYESGAGAALAGLSLRTLDSPDGTLPLAALARSLHIGDDPHLAPTRLICLEDTHNRCGGVLLPAGHAADVAALARPHGIPLHLDGARLWNAHVASGVALAELAAPFASVSVCFSKGLGAPVGSALVGSADAIARARRYRKMYGGGMRQAGVLAAAALHALDHHLPRLADDHRRARALAETAAALSGLRVDLARVHTNIVYVTLEADHPLAAAGPRGAPLLVASLADRGVAVTGAGAQLRMVTHGDLDDAAIDRAITALRAVMSG